MATSSSFTASQFLPQFSPQWSQDADWRRQLSFVPGLKELLMLRQVHALEHATVWVLSEARCRQILIHQNTITSSYAASAVDDGLLGGLSTDQGFYLYGDVDTASLRQAVQAALQRIVSGDWDLAIHPRCGTNVSVGMLLTAGFSLGMHLLLPRGPIEQFLGLGLATIAAIHLTPEVGELVQRYVTTAIPFNLAVESIRVRQDRRDRPVHFVRVKWVE